MVNQDIYNDDKRINLSEKGLDPDGLAYIGKKLEY